MPKRKIDTHQHFLPKLYVDAVGLDLLNAAMPGGVAPTWNAGAQSQSRDFRHTRHGGKTLKGFCDRTIDVANGKGFARGTEDDDLVDLALYRGLKPFHVGCQCGIRDSRLAIYPGAVSRVKRSSGFNV
ncbi:hypothetical protein P3T23_005047 [Paraburkholderia sp. GAS448]